ncbi:hypothetical protein J4218_06695 [Candidatus Pacearchaeota archaeon]|nr:hypothetical protein [Candidatus Pacearchaeota archaeon]
MVTTIQLNENVKNALDRLKTNKETYEEIILKLMQIAEKQKREQEELLIEGCKEMYNDMLEINKEWEAVDAEMNWEWNDGDKKRGYSSS